MLFICLNAHYSYPINSTKILIKQKKSQNPNVTFICKYIQWPYSKQPHLTMWVSVNTVYYQMGEFGVSIIKLGI